MKVTKLQEILDEINNGEITNRVKLFEHQVYKNVPGTKNSFRQDHANANTLTLKHAHVYARPNGRGKELYSLNITGAGHDGSSGIEIPASHANFFRSQGYEIDPKNILESLDIMKINQDAYSLILLKENA